MIYIELVYEMTNENPQSLDFDYSIERGNILHQIWDDSSGSSGVDIAHPDIQNIINTRKPDQYISPNENIRNFTFLSHDLHDMFSEYSLKEVPWDLSSYTNSRVVELSLSAEDELVFKLMNDNKPWISYK